MSEPNANETGQPPDQTAGQESPKPAPHPGGRPTKLTPELQDYVCQLLRIGNFVQDAAQVAGISKVTLYEWLRRGRRQKRGMYREFLNAVRQAIAFANAQDVAVIRLASAKDWRAAAWRLEHRHPRKWGNRQYLEHTGKRGGPIRTETEDVTDPKRLSEKELRRRCEEILKRYGSQATDDTAAADEVKDLTPEQGDEP